MKKITRKVRGRYSDKFRDEHKEILRFYRVEIGRITRQREKLKEFIKTIALEVDELDVEFQYLFDGMGLKNDFKIEVWSSEWEKLKDELQELNFDNRDLTDERDELKEKNERLARQLKELQRAFDEVRLFNPPHALKDKKQKI